MDSMYSKLRKHQFRLLVVVRGNNDRDLRFEFRQAVPTQALSYTAVSYTWGDEVASDIIHIDGRPFMIRPNLWACLHTLRKFWQYIWADAICINQNDITERNDQVRMMDEIYTNATVVSVWLGNVPIPENLRIEGRIVTLEVDDFEWDDAMDDIATRPYWSRCWVIQEFMLARNLHLYCSNTRVDDHFFRELLSRAADLELLTVEVADIVAQPEMMRKWPAIPLVVGRHHDRLPEVRQPLYDLLANNAYAQSMDPKDKVFALLGLLQQDERAFLQRSFPDYSLSMEQVTIVTLAHLALFAEHRPLEPIFRALNIEKATEIRRLLSIVKELDYIGASNPAVEVEWISGRLDDDPLYSRVAQETPNIVMDMNSTFDDLLRQDACHRYSKIGRIARGAGVLAVIGTVASVFLMYARSRSS